MTIGEKVEGQSNEESCDRAQANGFPYIRRFEVENNRPRIYEADCRIRPVVFTRMQLPTQNPDLGPTGIPLQIPTRPRGGF